MRLDARAFYSLKVVEMLVARLALVDAPWAPTTELRAQHRYKTLVVQTTDLGGAQWSSIGEPSKEIISIDAPSRHGQHAPGKIADGIATLADKGTYL